MKKKTLYYYSVCWFIAGMIQQTLINWIGMWALLAIPVWVIIGRTLIQLAGDEVSVK